MQFWGNLVGYQIVWFIEVINAAQQRAWPGVAAAAVFVAWQLLVSVQRALDLRLILAAALFGLLVEGGLAASGFAHYAAATPSIFGAPVWILSLWIAFSTTLTRSLLWLQKKPLLGVVFGAVGGPLAYLGAERGWGAVIFVQPSLHAIMWLGAGWAAAMAVFGLLIQQSAAADPTSRVLRRS